MKKGMGSDLVTPILPARAQPGLPDCKSLVRIELVSPSSVSCGCRGLPCLSRICAPTSTACRAVRPTRQLPSTYPMSPRRVGEQVRRVCILRSLGFSAPNAVRSGTRLGHGSQQRDCPDGDERESPSASGLIGKLESLSQHSPGATCEPPTFGRSAPLGTGHHLHDPSGTFKLPKCLCERGRGRPRREISLQFTSGDSDGVGLAKVGDDPVRKRCLAGLSAIVFVLVSDRLAQSEFAVGMSAMAFVPLLSKEGRCRNSRSICATLPFVQ